MTTHAQHLHLYATDREIAGVLAIMPNAADYRIKQEIFYQKQTGNDKITVVYHAVLVKQYFTNTEMNVIQAAAFLQPYLLYRLCDTSNTLVHDINSDRNKNEASFLGQELQFMRQMYEYPAEYYPFDIRDKLDLCYGSLCLEKEYQVAAIEAEMVRCDLVDLDRNTPENGNALVAYAVYLVSRLREHRAYSRKPGAKLASLQKQFINKCVLRLALCGLDVTEQDYIKRFMAR